MPRKSQTRTSPTLAPETTRPESASTSGALTAEQLARWAELVANGETPFPKGLTRDQGHRLLELVCQRRRARLVQFIARAIAQEIWRRREQPKGEQPCYASASIPGSRCGS